MSVSPGKNVMEVTGGSGDVFAREGSALVGAMQGLGFQASAFEALAAERRNSLHIGDNVRDIFKRQHVEAETGPKSDLSVIAFGLADSVSVKQFQQTEVPRPQVAQNLPAPGSSR